MKTRQVALGGGVAAVVLGVAFVVAPAYASVFDATRTAVVLLGALAGLFGFRAVLDRRDTPHETAVLPEVESPRTFRRPESGFTDRVTSAVNHPTGRDARALRDRLYQLAVRTLTTYEGYTKSEAETALRRGTWTDDPYAAAFFAHRTPKRPFRLQIRDVFSGRARFDRRVARVVAELNAVAEGR